VQNTRPQELDIGDGLSKVRVKSYESGSYSGFAPLRAPLGRSWLSRQAGRLPALLSHPSQSISNTRLSHLLALCYVGSWYCPSPIENNYAA